jgi:DNA-3-methyladenine glycosylase I
MITGPMPGHDGLLRCPWALPATEYLPYHDNECGQPVTSVQGLYERMTLEAIKSGLSWTTVLRKRENFRRAFAGFDPGRAAAFAEDDVARLLCDPGVIRNHAKITAAIETPGSLSILARNFQSWCSAIGVGRPRPDGHRWVSRSCCSGSRAAGRCRARLPS